MNSSNHDVSSARITRKRGEQKGWSIALREGRFLIRIRSKKYGDWSKLLPKTVTLKSEANEIARTQYGHMVRSKHGLQDKRLENLSLGNLIVAAIKYRIKRKTWTRNDEAITNSFLKWDKHICIKKLCDVSYKDFEQHINRRLLEDTVRGYTIRRRLASIITIYRDASTTELYGLAPGFTGELPVPFDHPIIKKLFKTVLKDTSGRERVLKPVDDLKIYTAINEQCRTVLTKRRMVTLVHLALTTALRRGVLLKLCWEDIDYENKVIRIKKTYFTQKKPAPPMVPITSQLEAELKAFQAALPELEKKSYCKLFPNKHERKHMHLPDTIKVGNPEWQRINARFFHKKISDIPMPITELPNPLKYEFTCVDRFSLIGYNIDKNGNPVKPTLLTLPKTKPGDTKWCDDFWNRLIRRTDLFEIDEDGEKDWFHFHDLRHTAVTRYRNRPYRLSPTQYEYLLGQHLHRYAHTNHVEWCEDIREAIEAGDAILKGEVWKGLTPRELGNHKLNPGKRALVNSLALSVTPFGNGRFPNNLPLPTPEEYEAYFKEKSK